MEEADTCSLHDLTVFLQKNSSKILNGRCNLVLATNSLATLNFYFWQNEQESEPVPGSPQPAHQPLDRRRPQTVAFLLSYVRKTPALKLINPLNTLQGSVDISRFSGLTFLEIKKVPVHMLNGLGCLRNQLRVLIFSRSVQSIKMLLCSCGGDMTSEASWSSLHTLNLGFNHIVELDDSLRLLPKLEVLDLSHNEIRHTKDYLECLSELVHLNLGFNCLDRVPSLGLVARTNLRTLGLRNNSLDNLSGLEDYTSLLEVDLANNCIYEGAELRTLGYLHNLKQVNLKGNPLAFDSAYRSIIVSKFPPEGASRKLIPKATISKPLARIPSFVTVHTNTSLNIDNEVSILDESTDQGSISGRGKRSKGKHPARKVRQVAIPDQDDRQEIRQTTASILLDTDIENTKRQHEKMRQIHGADWLLALQAPYSQSPRTSASETERLMTPSAETTITLPVGSGRTTQAQVETSGIESDMDTRTSNGSDTTAVSGDVSGGEIAGFETAPSSNVPRVVVTSNSVELHKSEDANNSDGLVGENNRPSVFLGRYDSDSAVGIGQEWSEPAPGDIEHELCSPLLVSLEDSGTHEAIHLFLTVKKQYIEEQDMYGRVIERLETKCLKSMEETLDSVWREDEGVNAILPVVNLTFDYIRRDKQKRAYTLEDEESCETLTSALRPILVENQRAAAAHKDTFQCLKCSVEFGKQQAKRKLHRRLKGANHRGANSSDDEVNTDIESWMNEILVCPSCSSDLIVELEGPTVPNNPNSTVATPTGSLTSFELNPRPTSSPWKLRDAIPVSSSEKSRSVSSTEYHSANDSPSSSPVPQHVLTRPPVSTSSSSGMSTLVNSSSAAVLTPNYARARHITEESHDDDDDDDAAGKSTSSYQNSDGDFVLPSPTILMSRGDETDPLENISMYPHEKLRELLKENVTAPFSQKYSLVPADILDGMASPEGSGENTPDTRDASNPSPSPGGIVSRPGSSSADIAAHRPVVTQGVRSTSWLLKKCSNDGKPPSSSEDDFVVLPTAEIAPSVNSKAEVNFTVPSDDIPSHGETFRHSGHVIGRAGSTDSEIAVLRDAAAASVTSDSVFDSSLNAQSNLANALSDAASKLEVSHSSRASLESSIERSGLYSTGNRGSSVNGDDVSSPVTARRDLAPLKLGSSSKESSLEASVASMIDTPDGNVDHRLKLYFSMSVFGSKEELVCMTKCRIFQFSKSADFDGLLVVSSLNVYVMKINKKESDQPSDWLLKRSQHSVRDLVHVHIGLGCQSFQLDFNNEGVLYTIVTRDVDICTAIVSELEGAIKQVPVGKKRLFQGVVRDHPDTLANLHGQVFSCPADGEPTCSEDVKLYILAYYKTVREVKKAISLDLLPVGILVTSSDLYLLEENHFWPLRQTKTRGNAKTSQFTLKEHYRLTDVGEVELFEDATSDITIVFFCEDGGDPSYWHLQTEGVSPLVQLLTAIKSPWQKMFGVELKQTIHVSSTYKEDSVI